jgi:hypothetical protein
MFVRREVIRDEGEWPAHRETFNGMYETDISSHSTYNGRSRFASGNRELSRCRGASGSRQHLLAAAMDKPAVRIAA